MATQPSAFRTNSLRLLTLVMTFVVLHHVEAYHLSSGRHGARLTSGYGALPPGPRGGYNGCDNGMVNIEVDWNPADKSVFSCKARDSDGMTQVRPKGDPNVKTQECTLEAETPEHRCLPRRIVYSDPLPTSGAHRPVWPAYGEYQYVPVQRWLHSLEHGAIVFLYHPCADHEDVTALKGVAQGCLRRHIISPYPAIPKGWNFAILAWKCKFLFQTPNVAEMVTFVKQHALQGPENINQDGGYTTGLLKHAVTVSDMNDTVLCPTIAQRRSMSERIKESSFQPGKKGIPTDTFKGLGESISRQFKNRFEPYKNIVDLSGGFSRISSSASEDIKKGFQYLKNEEKELESDLELSEEKLAEIKNKLGE